MLTLKVGSRPNLLELLFTFVHDHYPPLTPHSHSKLTQTLRLSTRDLHLEMQVAMVMYEMTNLQYQAMYNVLSFSPASRMATTLDVISPNI